MYSYHSGIFRFHPLRLATTSNFQLSPLSLIQAKLGSRKLQVEHKNKSGAILTETEKKKTAP